MEGHNQLVHYYVNQAGSGAGQFYSGSSFQKGYGIGGFLGGLFRNIVLPLFSRGAKAVGREALRAGSHVLADVASGEQSLQNSVQRHASEAGNNLMKKLSQKMAGSGIKRKRLHSAAHSKRSGQAVRIKKRKLADIRDIFSH